MAFLDENGVAQLWAAVKDRLAGAFDSVEFDVAKQAANLVSGDSIATAFGKLAKNYSSLLTSISALNTNLTSQINTKLNKSDVLANYTTTATGKALDASLGPAIKTKMDQIDAHALRINSLINVQQGRIFASGSVENVTKGKYHTITSLTIPANDTRVWVILAQTDSNIGDLTTYVTRLICSPDKDAYLYSGKGYVAGGGGTMAWGFVNPNADARTIVLQCYGYSDTTHRESGRMYAFAIANTKYDGS